MKKLAILLAALLILSACLVACNNKEEEPDGGKSPSEVVTDENGNTVTTDGTTAGTQTPVEEKTYTFTDLEQPVSVYALTALNLREQPSFADGVAKKSVNAKTELLKIAESNESSIDSSNLEYKWFKVEYEGKVYYVKSTLVTTIGNPGEGFVEVSKTLYAKGSLKVRAVPSLENAAVGYINEGDAVTIIAENTESGWYKIIFEGKYTPSGEYYVVNTAKWWSETPITAQG